MIPTTPRRDFLGLLCGGSLGMLTEYRVLAAKSPALIHSPAWKKHGELFRHHGEPAGGWVQNFTSTVEPLDENRWRVWASISVPKSGVSRSATSLAAAAATGNRP